MQFRLIFLSILISFAVQSQKKVIDHTVYNSWKRLEGQIISNDGNYVAYTIKPYQGDGYLYIYNQKNAKLDSIPRGYNQQFSGNSNFLVFAITAGFDTLRNCELNKIDKKKWPKDSLGIYLLERDSLIKIPQLKTFEIAESGDWISYTLDKNNLKDTVSREKTEVKPIEPKRNRFFKKKEIVETPVSEKKEKDEEPKSDGKIFTAFNPFTNQKFEYTDVIGFSLSNKGNYVALTTHREEKKETIYQLSILDFSSGDYWTASQKKTEIKKCSFNNSETAIAFLSTEDTNKIKQFELGYIDLKSKKWKILVDTTTENIPLNQAISEHRSPVFSLNDKELFFGIAAKVKPPKKDTLLESEKVKLDLWNYNDKRLQSQQLAELKEDKNHSDIYVYHLEEKKIVQLSNDSLHFQLPEKPQEEYFLAENLLPYQSTYNWTSPHLKDHYRISLKDGKIELIKKAASLGGELSPSGRYYTFYNGEEKNHILIDLKTKKETCLTCSRNDVKWDKDMNGQPQLAEPEGIYGWYKGENELMLKSEYDLWNYTISTGKLTAITNEEGATTKTRFSLSAWENDSIYLDFTNNYLRGFNEKTKATSLYQWTKNADKFDLKECYSANYGISSITQSKNKAAIIFRRYSVQEYSDVFLTNSYFSTSTKISNTNPQQIEYNWATVELIDWTSYDGISLQGLLYKPENYDEEKSYPLLVYYYELHSDEFHNHFVPRPTASTINPTEYASAGYFVFIPDIRYRVGHPAKSAYDCIMSGTDKVLKLYPSIDSKRMGLQGQSWGGYQTAQLITMTTRYAAAMAGAPVANMFSAYGGIRWESGLNRQFQYERQQSRIGKTIWEAPELYVENSPIFHLPNVKTPLLMMANDDDGAVPWTQGIELFTGLKRLGKPCWMLNYNGDKHNLQKNANKLDLSIRMRQFFDHYLQGAPAPKWLTEGIPATKKGETMGY